MMLQAAMMHLLRRNTMPEATFVPADLDVSKKENLEPLFQSLLEREIETRGALEAWLLDASELEERIDELGSHRYIDHTCHTDDENIERAYLDFVENLEPALKKWSFELRKKAVASPAFSELEGAQFKTLVRSWKNAVDLFREENVPLETAQSKLFTDYGKLTGSMMIEQGGRTLTIQQMSKLLEEPDREVRKGAWQAIVARREQDKERLDEIFTRLLDLRTKIARNAGFEDYRSYAFKERDRFDYSPDDCERFGQAIRETCVPMVESLDHERKERLGVTRLRPWDLHVDADGGAALRPFSEEEIPAFVSGVQEIFRRISPDLHERFRALELGKNLDLESRRGKRPGGYQASLEASRQPFIFMNAVGTQRDIETLLHEGGHAIHYLDAASEPLVFLRHAPLEFCEVASMSMELLGSQHFDVFYRDEDAKRAQRKLLEGILRFLPWMATIDGFQHWLYTHEGHSAKERREAWLEISESFSSSVVDWSKVEESKAWRWQAQIHLYGMPFYYIEYGIAQLGALQVWLNHSHDGDEALAKLRRAFALGGKRSLPELFSTAGLRLDFSKQNLEPLMLAIMNELKEKQI